MLPQAEDEEDFKDECEGPVLTDPEYVVDREQQAGRVPAMQQRSSATQAANHAIRPVEMQRMAEKRTAAVAHSSPEGVRLAADQPFAVERHAERG